MFNVSRLSGPTRNSMQAVFPPYFCVVEPGLGMEPRTPQKRTFIDAPAYIFKKTCTFIEKEKEKGKEKEYVTL